MITNHIPLTSPIIAEWQWPLLLKKPQLLSEFADLKGRNFGAAKIHGISIHVPVMILCRSRKYPYYPSLKPPPPHPPPQQGLEIPGGRAQRAKKFQGKYEGRIEFFRGVGGRVVRENPFCGGGMDIFYTTSFFSLTLFSIFVQYNTKLFHLHGAEGKNGFSLKDFSWFFLHELIIQPRNC